MNEETFGPGDVTNPKGSQLTPWQKNEQISPAISPNGEQVDFAITESADTKPQEESKLNPIKTFQKSSPSRLLDNILKKYESKHTAIK